MVTSVYINGSLFEVNSNLTVLQACGFVGIYIPRFCYHEKLSIVGSCRMCLVELYKSIKPVVACATPVYKDIEIYTETALTKNSREHVLEFLLINHPLDCPICDQGGECDLQDQSLVYGSDRGRFKEKKRAVLNKDFGPFIKTMMTRCIHCTRCVRFMSEVAGDAVLGTLGRGKDMEIGTYIANTIQSEISGNIIDICPVGALTSKPFAFTNRSWELRSVESVDIMDGLGSSIRLDFRGSEIVRILPMLNELLNECWITDKIRFTYDGFKYNRLITPLLRKKKWSINNSMSIGYLTGSWERSISFLISIIICFLFIFSIDNIKFVLGELIDIQTILSVMYTANLLGSSNITFSSEVLNSTYFNLDMRENYLFNQPISYLEQGAPYIFIGSNLQLESPLLNVRLNKVSSIKKVVGFFGSFQKNNFNNYHLGTSIYNIQRILKGKHFFCKLISSYGISSWISNINYSYTFSNIIDTLNNSTKYNNIINQYNVIHNDCNKIGVFDICVNNRYKQVSNYQQFFNTNKPTLTYYLGDDSYSSYTNNDKSMKNFFVYQGHHSIIDEFKQISLFLPSTSFIEKSKKYINNIGKVLSVRKAIIPPGLSKDDSLVINIINLILKHGSSTDIKMETALFTYLPHLFNTIDFKNFSIYFLMWRMLSNIFNETFGIFNNIIYFNQIDNYYKTNQVSKASKILAKMNVHLQNYANIY